MIDYTIDKRGRVRWYVYNDKGTKIAQCITSYMNEEVARRVVSDLKDVLNKEIPSKKKFGIF